MSITGQATKVLCFFALAGLSMCVLPGKAAQKLAPAELIAKHLDAIGPADARARVKGMRIKGTALLTVRQGGSGQVAGLTIMASQADRNLIDMTFDSPAYPQESLKFDGKHFTAGQFRPGVRTALGHFFVTYEVLFKEGLIGGTLSTSWPLLDLKQKNPKLEYGGIKKVGGRQLHTLKYKPHQASEMEIRLFFDSETFQHVRTEYADTIYATDQQRIGGGGAMPAPSRQRSSNTRINAFEEFSDFKPEGGLNLPHTHKFELSIQSEARPALVDWTFNLTDFSFNDVPEFDGTAPVKPS